MCDHEGLGGLLNLRAKLVLFIVGSVTLVQMAWGLSVVRSNASTLDSEAHRRGREILRAIAVPSAFHLANREVEALDSVLATYAQSRGRDIDFLWIAVLDTNGTIMAHTDPREYGRTCSDPFSTRAITTRHPLVETRETPTGRVSHISMPIVSGLRWGTLTAELSLSRLDERITQSQNVVLLSSTIISICTAVLLGIMLRSLIFLPLGDLSQAARAISNGELTARAPPREGRDELATLGQAFNDMAARVQEHTTTLEARVGTRTRELRSSNAALEQANEDLARAVDELERLANTDGLTQLSNHRSFQERLALEAQRSARTRQPMVLIMIDVDHFKAYNDGHGHPSGDKVLVQVSRIFQRSLRVTDMVARYGGEEFAIILLDTPVEAGAAVAEKLRKAIRETAFPGARKSQPGGRLTISLGMAALPDHGMTAAELLEAADAALYSAKRAGRDQVHQYQQETT